MAHRAGGVQVDLADIRSTVRAASEAGLVAVGEGVATFREALPEQTRIRAEETLGGSSPVRRSMVALVETAADRAEQAARRASERLEEARAEAVASAAEVPSVIPVSAPAEAMDRTAQAVVAKEAAVEGSQSRGTFLKMALAVVAIGAAAGAGYAVYAKRKAAAREHLSGEGEWGTPPAGAGGFEPGMADTQSPDAVDEAFAREVDEAADELAEEFVEAVEGVSEELDEAAPEAFEPGMADTQSPDVVDEAFAREVDEAADELAQDIVDAVEEPKK
jgi:hypothetical protein